MRRSLTSFTLTFPRYQREKLKERCRQLFKFGLTVVCAAVLAILLEKPVKRLKMLALVQLQPLTALIAATEAEMEFPEVREPIEAPRAVPIATAPQETWSQDLGEFYAKYLIEVMRALRADRSVRLVKLDVPHGVLHYQRNLAALEKGGETLKLHARFSVIPVVAVSRSSKAFLEEMRVTYIDPQALPPQLVQSASLALTPKMLQSFLLIPDFSGRNVRKFQFGRK